MSMSERSPKDINRHDLRGKDHNCHSQHDGEVYGLASGIPVLLTARISLILINQMRYALTKGSLGSLVGTGSRMTAFWP